MAAIITAITDVTSVVEGVFTVIVGNPLLLFFTAASLVTVGVTVFKRIKGAAR